MHEIEHVQHKVYASETNSNERDYLNMIYGHAGANKFIREEIYDTLHGAESIVHKDIRGKGAPALNKVVI